MPPTICFILGILVVPVFITFMILENEFETSGKVKGPLVSFTFMFGFLGIFLCVAYFVCLFF